MEVIGRIAKSNFYTLKGEDSCTTHVLSIEGIGASFFAYIQLSKDWKIGRSFYLAERQKTYLVWNNQKAKLRIIHDGAWIGVQQITTPNRTRVKAER